jgi:CRISPR-associated protein Csb2
MPSYFCLSIRFLDSAFHGRGDGNKPEWPPSPLRAFQSLVTAAARRRRARDFDALRWLEQQSAPILVAPVAIASEASYRISVPNNAMDIVAGAWVRGNDSNSGDANPATHRAMKSIRPMLITGGPAVHYLWTLADPFDEPTRANVETLCDVARSVSALGWGVDMAIGHGAILPDVEAKALPGERWLPTAGGTEGALRMPRQGTLSALEDRHKGFLNRIGSGGFTPPPPLTAYERVVYQRASKASGNPVAAFALRKPNGDGGFRSFDTARQALTVAGMMRYTAKLTAERAGWPNDRIATCILGHGEAQGDTHVTVGARRFAYLPLPTIEFRGEGMASVAGNVRRALLTTFAGSYKNEVAWSRRAMSGQMLIDEDTHQPVAVLSAIPTTDRVVQMYVRPSTTWATVTPVVLPGYDDPAHYRRRLEHGVEADEQKNLLDKLHGRTDALLRKAIAQAGLSQELADHADFEWRKVGFWAGAESADRYGVPKYLRRFPRFHVRIQWRDAQSKPVSIPGPICLGGGRFCGLGLLAAAEE